MIVYVVMGVGDFKYEYSRADMWIHKIYKTKDAAEKWIAEHPTDNGQWDVDPYESVSFYLKEYKLEE